MSDIVKGILGGGWSLLVGWILPSVINVLVLAYGVLPNTHLSGMVRWFETAGGDDKTIAVVGAGVLLGVLLVSIQTQLYRLLEGYVGWTPQKPHRSRFVNWLAPATMLGLSQRRQLRRKQILLGRVDLIELTALKAAFALDDEGTVRLEEVRADGRLKRYANKDQARTDAQLSLLQERLQRYPTSDTEIVPTRLGNAIRRLEEYGYDRFRLDSQRMWFDLTVAAPEAATKQVDQARTTVDLLVSMLYGNVVVAMAAVAGACIGSSRPWVLVTIAAGLLLLARTWYEVAIRSTDDWAAAVKALVNLGRKPLAEALGLQLPDTIDEERQMWSLVASLVARPYHPHRRAALDRHRAIAVRSQPAVSSSATVEQRDTAQIAAPVARSPTD